MSQQQKYRIAFMGSADFSVPILKALIAQTQDYEIVAVYCQPEKPAGRGYKQRQCPIHKVADEGKLPVFTPQSLKCKEVQQQFVDLQLDIAVVVAYGLLLPLPILQAPKKGCINVHASLLPRWRGASPIHQAILQGDDMSGVSLMQMDEGLDTGPVFCKEKIKINTHETTQSLHDKLSILGKDIILSQLKKICQGTIFAENQQKENITYAPKISRNDAKILWGESAKILDQKIRGYYSWPCAWFQNQKNERFKILKADYIAHNYEAKPGTIVEAPLVIACGEGALSLQIIQREGKTAQKIEDFIKGYPLSLGTVIS